MGIQGNAAVLGRMHIAELIEDELRERGWDRDDLAAKMDPHATPQDWAITRCALDFLMEVRCPNLLIDNKSSEQLGRAFDVDSRFFQNFHNLWREVQPQCEKRCFRSRRRAAPNEFPPETDTQKGE